MKADLHIHTSYSPDGSVEPREVVKIAKKRGLDVIAITDHNEIRGAFKAREFAKSLDIQVIVGIEISSKAGHILAYGVDEVIPQGLSVAETAEKIHDSGGIVIIAHPYRFWSGVGERTVRESVSVIDGIEIFNGRCTKKSNRKALSLWREIGGIYTGGSDAHYPDEIGKAGIIVDCQDELFECLSRGEPKTFGESRNTVQTLRYVRKAVSEWMKRGFKKI